jgi:NAD(P)H-hydrate epimerase
MNSKKRINLAKGASMKILTSKQMKKIDSHTINKVGIPGPVLMENAGLQIFKEIMARFPRIAEEKIVIIAGKGNNGGDGFVIARHLYNQGCDVIVLLLAPKSEIKGDAALNMNIADKIGIKIVENRSGKYLKSHKEIIQNATILVDAIFGTGLTKPAEGIFAKVISDVNRSSAYKIAVDIPSGLSSDTFELIGPSVKADLTVTLAAPKIAHIFPPAEDLIGEMVVADISIPRALFDDKELKLELVEKSMIVPYFTKRTRDTHKGTYGHLFILSGSLGKTGASSMAGKAALKMGAGLVTIGTPESCLSMVARSMDELMTEPLEETEEKTLSEASIDRITELLDGKDGVLIGPGISTHESTSELIFSLLPKIKCPLVLDADALNILAARRNLLKNLKVPAIITPHPGEFARLLHMSTRDVLEKRLQLVSQFSKEFNLFVVLKSYKTLVSTPEGHVLVNPTGNPGMASAGSGDVLSGMIASMIIQEKNITEAVLAAVYIHGLSGDLAAKKWGEKPVTAGNLISFLPSAIKSLS